MKIDETHAQCVRLDSGGMMCDRQPLREKKRINLSINDFGLVNGTMSRAIPRDAEHVYNVTHTFMKVHDCLH